MKKIIQKVMQHKDVAAQPPVLLDIGASGSLPKKWKTIAQYSICFAFDADMRDFKVEESTNTGYKKLFSLNRLVAVESNPHADFYLTLSPHCSSSLRPNNQSLKPWAFHHLFEVNKIIQMPCVSIAEALSTCGINYIDWYKTDTQGTDLRIFDGLSESIKNRIVVAEFEPGIIDAYCGEDKLCSLMSYMDKLSFWVSCMNVKGSQRIFGDDLKGLGFLQKLKIGCFLKTAPCWCEISYLNNFSGSEVSMRDYLIGWVFATIQREHGFALALANTGLAKFDDPLFKQLAMSSRQSLHSVLGIFIFILTSFRNVVLIFGGKL